MDDTPPAGHADVIAALGSGSDQSKTQFALIHARRAGLIAVLLSVPLVLVDGYNLSSSTGWEMGVVFLFGIAHLAAFAATACSIPFLFFPSTQSKALATFAFAGTVVVVFGAAAILSSELRSQAFGRAAERAEPLISAIEACVRDTGRPPATLQDLVPRYLPFIPVGLPDLKIVTGDTARARFEGNEWVLDSSVPTGVVNFDQFMYFPNQRYPEPGYGRTIERIGKWAYVHDSRE